MKKIKTITYQSDDGEIWETESEAIQRDNELSSDKLIPDEVKQIRKEIIRILNIENSYVDGWFEIAKTPTLTPSLRYQIHMKFDCSNNDYTKSIGNLLMVLADMPNSYISFGEFEKFGNAIILDDDYEEDLNYLKSIKKFRKK